jgi:monovalent cation/hydrogen antiporter
MDHAELLLPGLLIAIAALSAIAHAIDVPYPILLVLGGLALGFVPGIPQVELDPELVLVIFLPPLLYSAAFFSSLRDLRRDLRTISTLAIGLVLATMVTVAVVAHTLIDGMPWAVAFVLGAIVSPTDPLAASAIARRLNAPRRMVTITEGESLVNDGTALVAYKVALGAVAGSFSLFHAGWDFVLSAAGGVAIGIAVGYVVAAIRRRLDDPQVEITISLFTGYAAYVPANELGLSGVLAAVACGIFMGWRAPQLTTPTTRMQSYSIWEILVFLVNATLFVLVGLQLNTIVDSLRGGYSAATLIGWGAAISAVVIATRAVWLQVITFLIRTLDRRPSQLARRGTWRVRVANSWAGMRGSVSLAAALALPFFVEGTTTPFPQRDLIIFLTFAVIFVTLVLQGLTLPLLIRWLGIEDDGMERREELHARRRAAGAALEEIDALEREDWTRDQTVERMRGLYEYRGRRFAAQAGDGDSDPDGIEDRSAAYQRMVHSVIGAQRDELVRLRNVGEISDEVRRRVERELDLEETRLEL